jgi:uncharacterized membrane protein YfcA
LILADNLNSCFSPQLIVGASDSTGSNFGVLMIYLSALIGLFAGISSGIFGIGGGVLIVPMLLFILKFSQVEAVGTSLVALLLPVGSLGVFYYYKNNLINLNNVRVGLMISAGMVVGTYLGARVASNIDSKLLSKLFAIFLFFISIKIWRN